MRVSPATMMLGFILTSVLAFAGAVGRTELVRRPDQPLGDLPVRVLKGDGVTFGAPMMLHLWLPGCGACAKEVPAVEAVRARHGDDVRVLAISVAPDPARAREWATRFGIDGDIAVTTGDLMRVLGVRSVPATAWVDAEGHLVAVAEGEVSEALLERETVALR